MKDNLAEDTYMYEIIVQTGPMLSHGTESKVGNFYTISFKDIHRQIHPPPPPKKNVVHRVTFLGVLQA